MPRPLRAAISASALAHNLRVAQRNAADAKVWAVVKANAYGHGLLRAAKAFEAADGYAVLDFVEALALRSAGVAKPILMLEGFFSREDLPLLARHQLTPVVLTSALPNELQDLFPNPFLCDDRGRHADAFPRGRLAHCAGGAILAFAFVSLET